jgi:hypothetical protein
LGDKTMAKKLTSVQLFTLKKLLESQTLMPIYRKKIEVLQEEIKALTGFIENLQNFHEKKD